MVSSVESPIFVLGCFSIALPAQQRLDGNIYTPQPLGMLNLALSCRLVAGGGRQFTLSEGGGASNGSSLLVTQGPFWAGRYLYSSNHGQADDQFDKPAVVQVPSEPFNP